MDGRARTDGGHDIPRWIFFQFATFAPFTFALFYFPRSSPWKEKWESGARAAWPSSGLSSILFVGREKEMLINSFCCEIRPPSIPLARVY